MYGSNPNMQPQGMFNSNPGMQFNNEPLTAGGPLPTNYKKPNTCTTKNSMKNQSYTKSNTTKSNSTNFTTCNISNDPFGQNAVLPPWKKGFSGNKKKNVVK